MSIIDKVKGLFGGAREKAADAVEAASGVAESVAEKAKEVGSDIADKAKEVGGGLAEKVTGGKDSGDQDKSAE
ncbi:hypothetical protein [Thermocrispum municipale]|uniref:hypothetical protein n=1 Tax=Thermocrispum municipale TaxID=37926 RepID=UPI0004205BD0|nr:hypothetical protein [Thermocrispum municipale]